MMKSFVGVVAGAGLGLIALVGPVAADTYVITSDHSTDQQVTGGSFPNTGVTLTVTQKDADTVNVTATFASGWTILNNGNEEVSIAFALPFSNATFENVTSGFITVGPDNIVPGLEFIGNVHVGGNPATSFGYGLLWGTSGGGSGTNALSFDISNTGLTVTSFLQTFYACGGKDCSSPTALSGTFFADVSAGPSLTGVVDFGLSAIPLPPAALLFGTALVGMGILGRRRKGRLTQA